MAVSSMGCVRQGKPRFDLVRGLIPGDFDLRPFGPQELQTDDAAFVVRTLDRRYH